MTALAIHAPDAGRPGDLAAAWAQAQRVRAEANGSDRSEAATDLLFDQAEALERRVRAEPCQSQGDAVAKIACVAVSFTEGIRGDEMATVRQALDYLRTTQT